MEVPSSSNQNYVVIVKDSNKEVKVTFEPNKYEHRNVVGFPNVTN